MTPTPILSSRGRKLKPGALIIAAHYASVLNRSFHERASRDVLPSVIGDLGNGVEGIGRMVRRHDMRDELLAPQRSGNASHGDNACGGVRTRGGTHSNESLTAQALAHTPVSRDDKTGRPEREGGISSSGRPHARVSECVRGDATCVQNQGFQSDQQTVPTAVLPQENVLTAHLPLTMKAGSPAPLSASMSTSLEQLCIILQDLAMSGCVNATPPTMCAPVHISCDDFSGQSTASNGSTPRWTDAQSLGGSSSKERGKLLLLSELRKRRDLCGDD